MIIDITTFRDGDADEAVRIAAWAFHMKPEVCHKWLTERLGAANIRIARERGRVSGVLGILPMGQWFGGRSVSAAGIAGVAIAPEARGTGVGSVLMKETVRELRASGYALSVLYPATLPIYQRAGYEQAGSSFLATVSLGLLRETARVLKHRGANPASLRPATDEDDVLMADLYAQQAAATNGNLDRGEYIWGRARHWHALRSPAFVIETDGRPTGYLVVNDGRAGESTIIVQDLVTLTPEARAAAIHFLGTHASIDDSVTWWTGPSDPMLHALVEPRYELALRDYWMVRILDVTAAMATRGFSPGVEGTIDLAIEDEDLGANAGLFRLVIADGAGCLEPGGEGHVRVTVRGLAALFTGHRSAIDLQRAGLLQGPDDALAMVTSMFSGPTPWMPDRF